MNNILDTTYYIIGEFLSVDELINKLNIQIHLKLQCISVRDMASYTTGLHMVKVNTELKAYFKMCELEKNIEIKVKKVKQHYL